MVGSLRASRTASTLRGLQAQVQPVGEIVQCGEPIDESLVFGHPKAKATSVPKRWMAVSAIPVAVIACRIRDVWAAERNHACTKA